MPGRLRVMRLRAASVRVALALVFVPGAGAAASQRPASATPACAEAARAPSGSAQVRPTQRAVCNYGAAEFHQRLFRLIAARQGSLGIEAVERQLGLPTVTTAFDNARTANYSIILGTASGADEWSALISVDESFGPDIESRPARFRGTLRPVRINPRERGDLSIGIVLLGPIQPGHPACLSTAAIEAEARRHGWRDGGQSAAMDSGTVTARLERGGLALSYTPSACLHRVDIDQPGNPPIVPITPAESAALSRQSSERMGDELVERILSRRSDGEDLGALRAWARAFLGSRPDGMDPLDAAVQAMGIEELRQLAYRAVIGHYWGANREHCVAAIATGDVRGALARIAQERGWSPAELRALETNCHIFLDGRSYRYRELRPAETPSAGERR